MTPKKLYATVAFGEVITWSLLILAMVLKYAAHQPQFVPMAGPIHGFIFLCFCIVTVIVWVNNRWTAGRGVLGLLSAVIPFATVPFERKADRDGLLDQSWRFRDGSSDVPATFPERMLSFIVRKPATALISLLILAVIVFVILLAAGNPAEMLKK